LHPLESAAFARRTPATEVNVGALLLDEHLGFYQKARAVLVIVQPIWHRS
jgi:hypothetical protein